MTQLATVIVASPGLDHLEWLKFAYTQGMARSMVENQLLNAHGFEGFRYASIAETRQLLRSFFQNAVDSQGQELSLWIAEAGQAGANFLIEFGVTEARLTNPPYQLDLDYEMVPCTLLRYAYFYCGAHGTDIEVNMIPQATLAGTVGEALHEVSHVAGQFTYNALLGAPDQGRVNYSSLLVREIVHSPAPPTGFAVR